MGAGEPLGVGHGPGLGEHLQALLVVDQHPQALADDRVVVGDQDGGLVAVGALRGGHELDASLPAVDEARLRRLLDVGRSLVTVLDPEAVLQRLLEVARELTGARYAAIGVLDESRERLERFVTAGIDAETRRAIGDLPRGRGVLGVLIKDPRPLRLPDVSAHPQSYGFPLAHPPMHTFLGVPIVIEGGRGGTST